MESHEAGFSPFPHSLEIPSGFPHSHGLDGWIYVLSCPLNSNHRHRKGLVADVSGPQRNACPGTLTPTLEPVENTILVLRAKHPSWGARKLKARLEMLQPDLVWPAASTFGNILRRAGLTSPQKKRKRTTLCSEPFSLVTGPNQLWCMDFKGYFATGDGKRCDPFTITDAHSRYLIRCQIVSRMDLSQVRAICEAAMREYGMPARIRTDNDAPFAGTGLLGLSKLSLGWMKLGIVHERIQAGRPQQNGRHERMHRPLKEDTRTRPRHPFMHSRAASITFARTRG